MFNTRALSPSQATAVANFEAHLRLGTAQTWVESPHEVPLHSGHSSFIGNHISMLDLRTVGPSWSSPKVISLERLTSVDGFLHLTVAEVYHDHTFQKEFFLRSWILQASDYLMNARYSFIWCERGTDVFVSSPSSSPPNQTSQWVNLCLPSQKE